MADREEAVYLAKLAEQVRFRGVQQRARASDEEVARRERAEDEDDGRCGEADDDGEKKKKKRVARAASACCFCCCCWRAFARGRASRRSGVSHASESACPRSQTSERGPPSRELGEDVLLEGGEKKKKQLRPMDGEWNLPSLCFFGSRSPLPVQNHLPL